jgi:hypothetical protein
MKGDEIETVHVYDPKTGEFLGSVPKARQAEILEHKQAVERRRTAELSEEAQRAQALEAQARWALDQPWYIQADMANAAGMAMLTQGIRAAIPFPSLDTGDLRPRRSRWSSAIRDLPSTKRATSSVTNQLKTTF